MARKGSTFMLLVGLTLKLSQSHAQDWQTREHSITVDGEERSYLVFGPASAPDTDLPAMLVLHGGFGNAEDVDRLYGMNDIAEREGFVAVYPNGPRIGNRLMRNRRTWNAGECCGRAVEENVNDVAFIDAMIDSIVDDYRVDEDGAEQTEFRCAAGAPIIVRILPGVGHTWPGAEARTLQRNLYEGDFLASEAAWEFARGYSK